MINIFLSMVKHLFSVLKRSIPQHVLFWNLGFFSGYLDKLYFFPEKIPEKYIILCILNAEMPFKMHKIIFFPEKKVIKKNICVPTLPKLFRPVTWKTLNFSIWSHLESLLALSGKFILTLWKFCYHFSLRAKGHHFSPWAQGPMTGYTTMYESVSSTLEKLVQIYKDLNLHKKLFILI